MNIFLFIYLNKVKNKKDYRGEKNIREIRKGIILSDKMDFQDELVYFRSSCIIIIITKFTK